eukprot:3399133-Pyramimonas_sp.AAC.2
MERSEFHLTLLSLDNCRRYAESSEHIVRSAHCRRSALTRASKGSLSTGLSPQMLVTMQLLLATNGCGPSEPWCQLYRSVNRTVGIRPKVHRRSQSCTSVGTKTVRRIPHTRVSASSRYPFR